MVTSDTKSVSVTKLESEVTIAVSDPTPVALDWVTISGYLEDVTLDIPISGATIDLLLNGALETSTTTNYLGYYEFEANFEEGHYSLQARYQGDAEHDPDWSTLAFVDAWRPTTSITIVVSPTSGPPPLEESISGKITRDDTGAGIRDILIDFYRDDDNIESKYSIAGGEYAFTDTLEDTGYYIYYTQFEGNKKFQGCEGVILPCPACKHPVDVRGSGSEVSCRFCGAISEVIVNG